MAPKAKPLGERIAANVVIDAAGCWLWQLAKSKRSGYGVIGVGAARQMLAHRAAYETFVGPIPEGLHLDHLCRVRHCVNPEHLEPVTPKVNSQRSWPAMKLHCTEGHELFGANLRIDNAGRRNCRTCRIERERQRKGYRGPVVECKSGHPFDEANTYIRPNGNRACKRCRADATARWKQRQVAA